MRARKRSANSKLEEEVTLSNGTDLVKLTVAQLRAECARLQVDTTGLKKQLIARLQEWHANHPDCANAKVPKTSELTKAKEELEKTVVKKATSHKVDEYFPVSNAKVYRDYNCMLNQTNIGFNNNKYYVIQIVETDDGCYHLWTRWGRVGEPGANQHQQFSGADDAVKAFKKKFHDKTRNKFEERHKFVAYSGKYTLIEIEGEDEEEPCASTKAVETVNVDSAVKAPQILDSKTAALVKFIFDVDMFSEALTTRER
uniref:WGR domain-containing protein n=1 Tax=Parascaris univalens TaxID=6257 RepID=A0A915ACK1_PARUN